MKKRLLIETLFILLGLGMFATSILSADVPRMTKEELKELLGNPDLVLLDVRSSSDWKSSDLMIKGAIREEPKEINTWANKYPRDKIIVLYCA
jgi:hypothetical protein